MRVFLGTPTHGQPRVEWVVSTNAIRDYESAKGEKGCLLGGMRIEVGSYIAKNRNEIVRHMYLHDCDATLMMDHDVWAPENTLETMVAIMEQTGAGVIAGNLALHLSAPSTGYMDDPTNVHKFKHVKQRPTQTLAKVDRIASACVLVHRRVYDLISRETSQGAPYFGRGTWWMHWPVWDEEDSSWREYGEDISFSQRVTAVGETMLLAFNLGLVHYKPVALKPPEPEEGEE